VKKYLSGRIAAIKMPVSKKLLINVKTLLTKVGMSGSDTSCVSKAEFSRKIYAN
jgi:hypothetical protein